ncbi:hypothetical protein PLESTB_001732600 [Pleodorina starrii]|uniref:Trichohyalin-plectin-homology domain-containing protein n=1 Tax=Pleodorina starrii TaxID=330485 RepID=A0A9W6C154_9CHLO|nr:hypothetical protein PLESTM_000735000 [Pleodorina starrii]GLC61221.1 hypothetical protein PLESTB_001732600 [Pleodorina starrii]GLC76883.1 hypothetical protein PLESTF_001851400 [Pleodorina starrii]
MSPSGQKRGAVGLAAEALKEALVAKLQPGVKDSPINDGIFQAIKLVEAFLNSYKESQDDLDALKAQIKRIMMSQIVKASPAKQQQQQGVAGSAQERRTRSASAGGQGHPGQSGPSRAQRHHLGSSTSLPAEAEGGTAVPAGGAGGLPLYSRKSPRSAGSSSLDWTLPVRTLNRKAYVRNGDFGRMTLVQDDLARRAEAVRQLEEAERRRAHAAVVAEQMELLEKKKEAEREARRLAQLEMDEQIREFQISEEARLAAHREMQSSLRNFYAGQVAELQTRKRQEVEQRHREHETERLQLLEEERRDRERSEQLARANASQRQRIQAALLAAMDEKAAAKAAAVEEEMRYNREYVKKMDADEAARRAAVAMRQERMRKAFERGGGEALQASLEEQERASAARAARLAAELETKIAERERVEAERRQREKEAALRELGGQLAEKEAERRQRAEEEERARRAAREAEAEAWRKRQEEKEARRRAQAEARVAQKAAVAAEHRRRYDEYREPFEERFRWLHAGALSGTQRAFNNLGVPDGKAAELAILRL